MRKYEEITDMQNRLTSIIGTNLKKFREKRGLTIEQCANVSGVDKKRLKEFELLNKRPEAHELLALCNTLNVNISDIIPDDHK